MAIKPIAHSYWRRIKDGARTFESVPASVKDDVLILAQNDVQNSVISAEKYEIITGNKYA
jgi:hypothetical protein